MGRKKINYKVGERISFRFAGENLEGWVHSIRGTGKDMRYFVYDGSYTYPVSKDQIL